MSSKKMGRPLSGDPKNKLLKIRVDTSTIAMLDECKNALNTTGSDIIRKGIKRIYDDLHK